MFVKFKTFNHLNISKRIDIQREKLTRYCSSDRSLYTVYGDNIVTERGEIVFPKEENKGVLGEECSVQRVVEKDRILLFRRNFLVHISKARLDT